MSIPTARQLSTASRYNLGGISVDPKLRSFVDQKLLPGTGVSAHEFWWGLDAIVKDLHGPNRSLLEKRQELQRKIDGWHRGNPAPYTSDKYTAFLRSIGYLLDDPAAAFEIETQNMDAEIASVPAPQLVCPVDNARFILNAANARWGSVLDALYSTNAAPELPGTPDGPYDPKRGAAVFVAAHRYLDELFPLRVGSWDEVTSLRVVDGTLLVGLCHQGNSLWSSDANAEVSLREEGSFVGSSMHEAGTTSILLRKNGLHLEIVIDKAGAGRGHKAGIVDLKLESALSTICDFEDSACTVDAEDKVAAYTNWLGLMDRSLAVEVSKKGRVIERKLNAPRRFSLAVGSGTLEMPGQALLLARNVGMHMYTDMVTTTYGEQHEAVPVPEHFIDAMVTAAAALHDLRTHEANSRRGSIYIVKPKMHGPEEAALAETLMSRTENVLGLPRNTIKIGVMDEERRTSANLPQTMAAVKERLFFVNTGFLDRTADEIHTSMEAGAMLPKEAIKAAAWYQAYETGNVAASMQAALPGRGQIGKGMWAEPDDMRTMLAQKGKQLESGASTAWVPSPIAATLHALHYLRQDVTQVQHQMLSKTKTSAIIGGDEARQSALLTAPLLGGERLTAAEVQAELDNNAQGLLGYVVRWVGQGVGCSKVPNLQGKQLMEDRATLRISSQHIANWLLHGVVAEQQVMETLRRVAKIVDEQNTGDNDYKPMAPTFDGPEWHAAIDLIFHGRDASNGYTEATLSHWRRMRKAADAVPLVARSAERLARDEQVYRRGNSMGGAM